MKAVIIAGGKGTRMNNLTKETPKPMLKIAGKPILEHLLMWLKKQDIKEVIMCLNYLPDRIMSYFGGGENLDMNIAYSIEKEPLGTAGCLKLIEPLLKERFLVVYGDLISEISIVDLLKFHELKKGIVSIAVKNARRKDCDVLTADSSGKVKEIISNPKELRRENLHNEAIYIAEPEIFKFMPEGRSDFMKDLFPLILKQKEEIYAYKVNGFIEDTGTPERFEEVEKHLLALSPSLQDS